MNLNGTTINFPFRPDERGTVVTSAKRSEIIAQAIADVVETRQGERVMMPDYGIPDFVFAVQDIGFAARMAYYIEQQVIKYVPLVKSIVAKAETDELGRAIVTLQYTEVGEINAPKNLVFPVFQFIDGFSVAVSSPVTNNEDVPIIDTAPPNIPANLSISAVSTTELSGSFSPSTDNVGVTRYRLRRATNAGFTTNVVETDLGTETTFSVNGLSPETTYYFKVLAEDLEGNQSDWTPVESATTNALPVYWQSYNEAIWTFESDKSLTLNGSEAGYADTMVILSIQLVNVGDFVDILHYAVESAAMNIITAYDESGNAIDFASNGNFNQTGYGYTFGDVSTHGATRRITRAADNKVTYRVGNGTISTPIQNFVGNIKIRIPIATFPWVFGLNIKNPTTNT